MNVDDETLPVAFDIMRINMIADDHRDDAAYVDYWKTFGAVIIYYTDTFIGNGREGADGTWWTRHNDKFKQWKETCNAIEMDNGARQ